MKNIVVGYDGSQSATRALEWAAQEAERRHLGLTVLRSWADAAAEDHRMSRDYADPMSAELRAKVEIEAAVDAIVGRHRAMAIRTEVTGFGPTKSLVAASHDAEMVVVGARGRGGFPRQVLGSVSHAVASLAACTVVVVRGDIDRAGDVVVGVDGSATSRMALRWAATEARLRDRPLRVAMAWSYLMPEGEHGPIPFRTDYSAADAEAALGAIVDDEVGIAPDLVVREEAVCGLATQSLVALSESASMIVVGPRGRSLHRWAPIGSAALQVLHHAGCPVALVRNQDAS